MMKMSVQDALSFVKRSREQKKGKLPSREVLIQLCETLLENLNELDDTSNGNAFVNGQKYAYIECLEIMQDWEEAENFGLDLDIESRFPL